MLPVINLQKPVLYAPSARIIALRLARLNDLRFKLGRKLDVYILVKHTANIRMVSAEHRHGRARRVYDITVFKCNVSVFTRRRFNTYLAGVSPAAPKNAVFNADIFYRAVKIVYTLYGHSIVKRTDKGIFHSYVA